MLNTEVFTKNKLSSFLNHSVFADPLINNWNIDQIICTAFDCHFFKFNKNYIIKKTFNYKCLEKRKINQGFKDPELETFFGKCKAEVCYNSYWAKYNVTKDKIEMPFFAHFYGSNEYYTTFAHELIHWTGHSLRLDRGFSQMKKFGDEKYAKEEIIAVLGAFFLLNSLGIEPKMKYDINNYIHSWLKLINKKKFIFTAASKAHEAVNYIHSLVSITP